jgi:hypothetical protein
MGCGSSKENSSGGDDDYKPSALPTSQPQPQPQPQSQSQSQLISSDAQAHGTALLGDSADPALQTYTLIPPEAAVGNNTTTSSDELRVHSSPASGSTDFGDRMTFSHIYQSDADEVPSVASPVSASVSLQQPQNQPTPPQEASTDASVHGSHDPSVLTAVVHSDLGATGSEAPLNGSSKHAVSTSGGSGRSKKSRDEKANVDADGKSSTSSTSSKLTQEEVEVEEPEPVPEPTHAITPHVGFVLKTKREGDQSKVFINIFYHEEKELHRFVLSAPAKTSVDKKGVECEAYDVSIPYHYFVKCSADEIARREICVDSIYLVNDRYSEDLSLTYVLPIIKKGFVGDSVANIEVPESMYTQVTTQQTSSKSVRR